MGSIRHNKITFKVANEELDFKLTARGQEQGPISSTPFQNDQACRTGVDYNGLGPALECPSRAS